MQSWFASTTRSPTTATRLSGACFNCARHAAAYHWRLEEYGDALAVRRPEGNLCAAANLDHHGVAVIIVATSSLQLWQK